MGSGHILVYAFDVLMQIYESEGYNPRDAAKLILEKNLYGLDIDRRAYQLAYFSLMMKARQYNRRIFTEGAAPQVYYPCGNSDLEEYGSLLKVDKPIPKPEFKELISLFELGYEEKMHVWNYKRLLADKYDVVVTNPPYMGSSGMGAKLSDFVKKNYPDSKSDLFAVFIEKCGELLKPTGYQAMITQHAWMFLSSFEKLRGKLIARDIVNMAHLGARAFEEIGGEVVQTTSFVLRRSHTLGYRGTYCRLIEPTTQQGKEDKFLSGMNRCAAIQDNFSKIPGSIIAYWLSNTVINSFSSMPLSKLASSREGVTSGCNDTFLRLWFEVNHNSIDYNCSSEEENLNSSKKWFTHNKGGEFRRWYGNKEYVINWWKDGVEIRSFADEETGRIRSHNYNLEYNFREYLTWSNIASGLFSLRYSAPGSVFDTTSSALFVGVNNIHYILALLNSNVAQIYLTLLCPMLKYQPGNIIKVPVKIERQEVVCDLANKNIFLSRSDWDSFETSWDFKRHPLICGERTTVAAAFGKWEREAAERFDTLKVNEEELNRIFIDIYGLQDELTPEVEDKDVTVRRADLGREIRSLISYAVGCMFGRYSLDTDGLAYAGGEWDKSKYITFIPDKDNILPICDDEYFDDDILGRFVDFVRVVYGAETLEENLKFIADALGGKGTPREAIRNYFLNDFYADHCKIYQKRPIYWLFGSGKKNGFKALVYLHRYSRDLLAKLRTDYVHEQQERYHTQLTHIATALNTATGAERARLLKRQDKLTEQLKEITAFEENVHHLADQNIEIDLDDGVKKNYEIFTDVLAKI